MAEGIADPWLPINQRADAELALSFARFFWPQFVERRGCVVLAHRADDDQIALWLEKTHGDVQQVEAVLNHVHLYDELRDEDSDDSVLMELGRIMKDCWTAALAKQFPGHAFAVELASAETDYGPTLYMRSVSRTPA